MSDTDECSLSVEVCYRLDWEQASFVLATSDKRKYRFAAHKVDVDKAPGLEKLFTVLPAARALFHDAKQAYDRNRSEGKVTARLTISQQTAQQLLDLLAAGLWELAFLGSTD